MEVGMANLAREPQRDVGYRQETTKLDAPLRTSPRQAVWSAAILCAIIVVMFVAFYGINAQRTNSGAATATAVTPPATETETTGQR
jgi:hypothetical protein